jgi:hypothetical protein
MIFSVMVHPAAGQFEAILVGAPEVCATAATREEALAALEAIVASRTENRQPERLVDIFQDLAGHGVLLPNVQEVEDYLTLHPQLALMLPSICADVRQAVGAHVELSLELYKDPEIEDRYLTLYVRKEKYEPDILDHLEAISDRFNANLAEIPGYFLLATDFSLPRGSHAV